MTQKLLSEAQYLWLGWDAGTCLPAASVERENEAFSLQSG